MKLHLHLNADSVEASRQFYVDELCMFAVQGEVWETMCALRGIYDDALGIDLASFHNPLPQSKAPLFTLVVDDCCREFLRLRATNFASGGRILPDEHGNLTVFEYPGGMNFQMEDPAGNRFVIHEQYGPALDEEVFVP